MGTEWKRTTMQNGAVIATVSSILITAGALLWYERGQPRYPTARDEAEARFGLLERMMAQGVDNWGDAPGTSTNVVGLYPSRYFWRTALPAAVETMDGQFLDLWAAGGGGDLSRSVGAYPNVYAEAEVMDFAWWTNRMYEGASDFGDFQYLHTNTLYMSTNLLGQVGRALSAMRWTWEPAGVVGTNVVSVEIDWYGAWHDRSDKADALAAALADLETQAPSEGLDGVTNASVRYQYVRVRWSETATNTWLVQAEEHARFRTRRHFAPLWTNCVVYHVGGFQRYLTVAGAESFWHPIYGTSLWEMAEAPAMVITNGYQGRDEALYNWGGRIPSADITAVTPVDTNDVSGSYYVGYRTLNEVDQRYFVIDWRMQCMTNRAAFWE